MPLRWSKAEPRWARWAGVVGLTVLAACGTDDTTAPTLPALAKAGTHALSDTIRQLAAGRGIVPLERPARVRQTLVRLGRALAFDKVLSGNHDISCMSCHLPKFATGDARSLSIGAGASGLGPERSHPQGAFIARNAPPAFNLFALEELFWDGRVSRDAAGQIHTPAGAKVTPDMALVFEFGPLSAQPMFPVLSRAEMRGDGGNELAALADDQEQQIWAALMSRLGRIPEYRQMFQAAYPGTRFEDMTFAHASNAIAGFLIADLSFNNSPWDRFLAGNDNALTPTQLAGAKNFMSARCSVCHNGPAFTDNKFHNVAVAQLGPGEGDGGALGLDAADLQRRFDQLEEASRLAVDALEHLLLRSRQAAHGAIAQHLGIPDDDVQRGAQLVRDRRDELRLHHARLSRLVQQLGVAQRDRGMLDDAVQLIERSARRGVDARLISECQKADQITVTVQSGQQECVQSPIAGQ